MINQPGEGEDDNIVTKVVTQEADLDIITFDPVKKPRRDPTTLPESVVEKYGSEIKLSKRE